MLSEISMIEDLPIPTSCEMCGKQMDRLDGHHTVPRFLGGNDKDLMFLCRSCHRKVECKTIGYILNPFGDNGYGENNHPPYSRMRTRILKYAKDNESTKYLYNLTPCPNTRVLVYLRINWKTGYVGVHQVISNRKKVGKGGYHCVRDK